MPRWLKFGLLGCGGLVVLGVLLFVVLLFGMTVGSGGKQGSGESSSTNVEAAVGETAKLRDRTLAVNEVEQGYFPAARSARKAQVGNEFVRIYVTLKNTGSEAFNYNLHDFEVQDSNGVQKNSQSLSELPYPIEFGDLAPGGTLEGNMVFEVPQGDSGLELIYTTDIVSKRTVIVPL